jgi:hypothetical protein
MRRTDPESTTRSFFRSKERVFVLNGQWFYTTREGENGPFPSRETALKEANRFVVERQDLDRFQKNRERETKLKKQPGYSWSIEPKGEIEMDLSLEKLVLEGDI